MSNEDPNYEGKRRSLHPSDFNSLEENLDAIKNHPGVYEDERKIYGSLGSTKLNPNRSAEPYFEMSSSLRKMSKMGSDWNDSPEHAEQRADASRYFHAVGQHILKENGANDLHPEAKERMKNAVIDNDLPTAQAAVSSANSIMSNSTAWQIGAMLRQTPKDRGR